jgi:hypothetical protein
MKSYFTSGEFVEQAIVRAGMLDHTMWKLRDQSLLTMLSAVVYELAMQNFEIDKPFYYSTKMVTPIHNGKRSVASGSYNATSGILTVLMTPYASINDVGKVVTFFDADTNIMYAGVIEDFIPGAVPQFELRLFIDAPTIATVTHVTIGNWLIDGDVIQLTGDYKLFSSENIVITDLKNECQCDIKNAQEFARRKTMKVYRDSSSRWAMYENGAIRFNAGSNAPAMGTMVVGGYWLPNKIRSFASKVQIPEHRVEDAMTRMTAKLLGIKNGQPVSTSDMNKEVVNEKLRDEESKNDIEKVR